MTCQVGHVDAVRSAGTTVALETATRIGSNSFTHYIELPSIPFVAAARQSSGLDLPSRRRLLEDIVISTFSVTREELRQPSRGVARIAFARQVTMYLAHVEWGLSLTEVGRMLGRDRTTVAHACAQIEDRRDSGELDRTLDLLVGALHVAMLRCESRPASDEDGMV